MELRQAIEVSGVVQGVGFRPFVWREASGRRLTGWVRNGAAGVEIEAQGAAEDLRAFVERLRDAPPALARVERVTCSRAPLLTDEAAFVIQASDDAGGARPAVPPDLATCAACQAEVAAPDARRHRYPFTNCTDCGPRWSIVESLPYDRPRTSMAGFPMCAACAAEYGDPADRRFHAQPIACPACGPRLSLVDASGRELAQREAALRGAVEALRAGRVLALKGLGGFQLLVDATSEEAVGRLRERKRRPTKPLALLMSGLAEVGRRCRPSEAEAALLSSPRAPILLLARQPGDGIAEAVSPGLRHHGVMLPTTPLHALLARDVGGPLVCTSGNRSGEPMAIDLPTALDRLAAVADLFLTHDRPILRPVDDSVARVGAAGPLLIRRARGWAPEAIPLPRALPRPVLALGGQLKNTVALGAGDRLLLGPHLGDLSSPAAVSLLERTVEELLRLYRLRPERIACDLHPDYAATRVAERLAARMGLPLVRVQHHQAHVAAVMAEHGLTTPVLGLSWDGAGLGADGTIWGGEGLVCEAARQRRVAHLRPFGLAGGERAIAEPRRAALGLLFELGQSPPADAFSAAELRTLQRMLARGVHAPTTSSVGRLFDGVASLTGLCQRASYEGEAAMRLEAAAHAAWPPEAAYPLPLSGGAPAVADWGPLVRAVCQDRRDGVPTALIAARFHAALVELALRIARRAALPQVALSGGCFSNGLLADAVRDRLSAAGFEVLTHRCAPPGDGGLSLGQAWVAAHEALR